MKHNFFWLLFYYYIIALFAKSGKMVYNVFTLKLNRELSRVRGENWLVDPPATILLGGAVLSPTPSGIDDL